jgi:pimeloyl-ACP methyl ester carboxylesterase
MHRVIVMDFIGFHGSDKPDTQYHNALLSQFLSGFIGALELQGVTLLGHAMGANTATYTAVHHPDSIAALILVDGAGYRNPDRDLSKPPSQGMLEFRRIATGSNLVATRGLLERRVVDKALVTDHWVEEAFSLWLNSARAIGDMLLEGGDLAAEEMRRIRIPTLIVWGAGDTVFAIENVEKLKADIDGAEAVIIENSGHLPQIEQTDAFLNAVIPFLNKQQAD